MALTPLIPASSVRSADCTAAFASVPDDFAISGFDWAMLGSERGGKAVAANPSLARSIQRCDA